LNAALTCLVLGSSCGDDEPTVEHPAPGAGGHAAAAHEPAADGVAGSEAAAGAGANDPNAFAGAGGESLCG
ncbi:MAG TPA: hypothetical protein VJR89_29720, partial [Polyangiales bacterium]|nr:hypothetical protein [Polyangiales bacterium]